MLKETMWHFEKVIGENKFLLAFDSPPERVSQIVKIL
ncbi:Protein of unknown function [Bacillus cereus]|nr:Protein of unknown function [Bacillus cereus]